MKPEVLNLIPLPVEQYQSQNRWPVKVGSHCWSDQPN